MAGNLLTKSRIEPGPDAWTSRPARDVAVGSVRVLSDVDQFNIIKSKVIRPLMDDLCCFLCDRFIASTITENHKTYDMMGRLVGSSCIVIHVFLDAARQRQIAFAPFYAISWQPMHSVSGFHTCLKPRLIPEQADGTATLDELTSDFVAAKLFGFARNLL